MTESLTVRRIQNENGQIDSVVPYREFEIPEVGFLWLDLEIGTWEQRSIDSLSARVRQITFDFGKEITFMIAMPLVVQEVGVQQLAYGVISRPQQGQSLHMQRLNKDAWTKKDNGYFADVVYGENTNLDSKLESGTPGGRSSRDLECREMSAGPVVLQGIEALIEPGNPQRAWAGPFYRLRMLLTCNMNHIIGDFVVRVGRLTAFSQRLPTPDVSVSRPNINVVTEILDRQLREDERPRVPEGIFRNPFLQKRRHTSPVQKQKE